MNLKELEWKLGQFAGAGIFDSESKEALFLARDLISALRVSFSMPGVSNAKDLVSKVTVQSLEKKPRVLVVVSGGIADAVHDQGVDVVVFDWDNYKDEEPLHKQGVPAHFADLARTNGIPILIN